jgi:hypothetical protein
MTLENVFHFLVIAHLHSAPKLLDASLEFLVVHKDEDQELPEWKELEKKYQNHGHSPDNIFIATKKLMLRVDNIDLIDHGYDCFCEYESERSLCFGEIYFHHNHFHNHTFTDRCHVLPTFFFGGNSPKLFNAHQATISLGGASGNRSRSRGDGMAETPCDCHEVHPCESLRI